MYRLLPIAYCLGQGGGHGYDHGLVKAVAFQALLKAAPMARVILSAAQRHRKSRKISIRL